MSIPVPTEDLARAMAGRPYAYLLTVSDDGRPHAVAVTPQLVERELVATVGRRSATNVAARPHATSLVWPPSEVGGYSLIVDGTARVEGESVHLVAAKAVLHRPAPEPAGGLPDGACGSDCRPIGAP
jgi:hypothetical protein